STAQVAATRPAASAASNPSRYVPPAPPVPTIVPLDDGAENGNPRGGSSGDDWPDHAADPSTREPSCADGGDPAVHRLWSIATEHAVLAWQEGPESFDRFKAQWSALRSRLPCVIPDAVLGATIRRLQDALCRTPLTDDAGADKIRRIQELLALLTDECR
ncbi:MAG: hypothetical protein ACUVTW_13370, partial [Thermogutta sp.]